MTQMKLNAKWIKDLPALPDYSPEILKYFIEKFRNVNTWDEKNLRSIVLFTPYKAYEVSITLRIAVTGKEEYEGDLVNILVTSGREPAISKLTLAFLKSLG